MIKHICECDICWGVEHFDPDTTMIPYGWHKVYNLLEDRKDCYICRDCWEKFKEYAQKLHAEECFH